MHQYQAIVFYLVLLNQPQLEIVYFLDVHELLQLVRVEELLSKL